MALFGLKKSEKKNTSVKKVKPVVVRTQNVASEIFKVAQSHGMKPEEFDFNFFDVQTYTRLISDDRSANVDWSEISPDQLNDLDKETQLLNPNFQIKQVYEIEIFLKHFDPEDPTNEFRTAIGANASKCKIYLSVLAGSKLATYKRFADDFSMMINKKKVRAGILIYIFDRMVDPLISKISAQLEVAEKLKFAKNETYLVAESFEPTATINDKIILHYESNHEIDEHERINYASRGFIQSVKEGDLLIEYIKPKPGKPGRNCKGIFIKPAEPEVKYTPTFSVDDTIKRVEDAKGIKYYAKENGYIAFENNTYTIRTDVKVDEVSFKKTGSIESGIDSDVSMVVKEKNAIKDAVGQGMNVEVTEIEIDGNVGSHATVKAKKATVGGQTHKTAIIHADDLQIHVHKGEAYGKKVAVERLEHGEISADEVHVSQALGGYIRGRDVIIDTCASHVRVVSSRYIEIKKLVGSENNFTIDPLLQEEDKENVAEHEKKIEETQKDLEDIQKEIKKYKVLVKEGLPAFIEIKKRLVHYKKNGVKMPESFVKKYKQYQHMQEHLKSITQEAAVLEDKLNLLTTRTVSFQDNIMDARVIMRGTWKGYNTIKFKLVDPPLELVYKPVENSTEHVFGLVQVGDDEYAIRPMDEEKE